MSKSDKKTNQAQSTFPRAASASSTVTLDFEKLSFTETHTPASTDRSPSPATERGTTPVIQYAMQHAALLSSSLHVNIPDGLKEHQRLTMPGVECENALPFKAWEENMLRLFRKNGVLDIMHDTLNYTARRTREKRLAKGETVLLSGATTATTADLDVYDKSSDMTLLLRANDLIDASIDDNVAAWVAGVNNPHAKWHIIDELMGRLADVESEILVPEDLHLADFFDDLHWDKNVGVRGYVTKFMQIRASVIATYGMDSTFKDRDYMLVLRDGLVRLFANIEEEIADVLENEDGSLPQVATRVIERLEMCDPLSRSQAQKALVDDRARHNELRAARGDA